MIGPLAVKHQPAQKADHKYHLISTGASVHARTILGHVLSARRLQSSAVADAYITAWLPVGAQGVQQAECGEEAKAIQEACCR